MLTQFNAKWRDYCWMSFLSLYTVFLTLHTLYKHNILPSMSSTNQINCTILTLSWKVKNWFATVTWLLKNYSSPTKFVFWFFYHRTVHTSTLFIILQNNVWNTDSVGFIIPLLVSKFYFVMLSWRFQPVSVPLSFITHYLCSLPFEKNYGGWKRW